MMKAKLGSHRPQITTHCVFSSVVGLLILGCSGTDSTGTPPGGGGDSSVGGSGAGASSAGGAPASGGATAKSTGGAASTGGSVANPTGGVPSAGGNMATGGSKATGGAPSTGGGLATGGKAGGGTTAAGGGVTTGGSPASTGGSQATGGKATTGGMPNTGGSKSTGGMTATGGKATGGVTATGGSNATGGAPVTGGSKATGGTPATGGSASGCMIPAYDSANPPTTLTLTGNLGTHDPVVFQSNGVYYQYATGNGIGYKTSTNLTAWTGGADIFATIPAWVAGSVSGVTNIWAPDISYFGGQFHLYYSVSTFGTNKSCIGHATRASLSTGSWTDHGSVICSNVGTSDNWNAIDPNIVLDDAGTPWMSFGSFWNGIMMIKMNATTGARADSAAPVNIARNSSIEGAFIIHQCGYYYLFVSFGACCGTPWDYNIRVGRSTSVGGPYVDRAGTSMLSGGGNLLVQGNSTWTAPGHNAILITSSGAYNIYHALNASHANPTLRISELAMDAQGWPVSGGP